MKTINPYTRSCSLAGLMLIIVAASMATPIDTSRSYKTDWHLVPRVQSLGFFAYAGKIGGDNPTFDFNIAAEKGNWGVFLFKMFDTQDMHSASNFLLTMVYRKFPVGKRLVVKPYLGFLVEQTERFIDHDSDMSFVLNTSYRLDDHWTIENSAIFPHVLLERNSSDWINRFIVKYNYNHFELILYSWHNNKVLDGTTYLSEGVSTYYNKIRLSNHADLNTGITGLWMMHSSDEQANPRRNGLLLTISVNIH